MAEKMAFLLFGDQSLGVYEFLADFYQHGNPSVLALSFLDQVAAALREEVDRMSTVERHRVPYFSSIKDLNENYQAKKIKNSAVDSALLCITQLAHYIDRSEKVPEDVTQPEDTCLVGLCTGLFAAAAIASSQSLSTLVPIAVQVTLMAFRAGAHVTAMAERLHKDTISSEPWTYVLPSITEDETRLVLDKFHNDAGIPSVNRVYISAITSNSIAISGAPASLKLLFDFQSFEAKPIPIPVHGPYHAAHLHSVFDADKILRTGDSHVQRVLGQAKPRYPVLSCRTGELYSEENSISLIQHILRDILTEPLRFPKVVHGSILKAQSYRGPKCLVIPFGPTKAATTLATILKAQTSLDIILRRSPSTATRPTPTSNNFANGSNGRCKLAIVGMAGRFPDAASHEKLWDLLEKGLDVHREVPKDRFDAKTHTDTAGKTRNTSHTPYGCWIENPGLFDPRFFNMSPREALQTDPMQRLSLVTAFEALEMAGYVPNRTRSTKLDRIGTFYGQTSDDWREINAAQDVDTYFITGGVRAFGPGRINYHFGFSGPSFSIDTACSSSAAAIQLACTSLWAGDCDTAIVGGVSCMTNSDIFAGLSRGQFLSKTGPCATFDNDADGYCRADAVGSVIVKRLEDALADKDNVLAVILGTATNHSADAISITHPHGGTQELLYQSILARAGVDPLDIDYVEMHGTGDGTEMRSVTNVFAPVDRKRTAEQPLYLGAVKANVGHGEAASGVTALIKVLMMLQKNAIPPHVGIKNTINKGFPSDLAERNVHIAFHKTPLRKRTNAPRRVFVNNFSAAGGNTGLLLEEAPSVNRAAIDPRSSHVVTVTAKSKSAMLRNAQNLISYLTQHPTISLADVAYTTSARRIQHNWRMSIATTDISEAAGLLGSKLAADFVPVPSDPPKVGFLFTGQGSHYAAMGKELYTTSTLFKETIDDFDTIATIHGFPSFVSLIDGGAGDVQTLSPVAVQIGIVCLEMALAKLWDSWGIKPAVVLGHSLGEYAALNVSGVLSASDAIYLVGSRAQLLVRKCTPGTHVMLAVQGSLESVTKTLGRQAESVNIACVNSIRETVLSGEAAELSQISDLLTGSGYKCTQLKVPFAFHSAQVDPILDEFQKTADPINFGKAGVPIISTVLGRMLDEHEAVDAVYLRNHARNRVNFAGGLQSAQLAGAINDKTVWIEVGPHPVCSNMAKATLGISTITAPSLHRGESAYKTIAHSLCTMHTAGLNIDWNEYHRDFSDSVHLLDLPTYSFDDKNYWIQYEGDWCLTKGDGAAGRITPLLEDTKPKLSTTSVQKIVSESVKDNTAVVRAESDLAEPNLRGVVTGHLVNGAMLCPSSLYADMAMTLAEYAYRLVRPDAMDLGMNIANMKVPKPLIARPDGASQILSVRATVDVIAGKADLVFSTGSDKTKVDHGICEVFFSSNKDYLAEWQRTAYLIKSRIDWLEAAEKSGGAHKVGRGLAYKLFAALVDYNPRYRGMGEVILHSENFEATAKVDFQTNDGNFKNSPYWIDSVCHISGFIVNGSDAVDSRENVYISHGWESLRFAEPLSKDKTYRSYVRMQPEEGKVLAGDVYIFDGDRIVGMVGCLKFQCLPRKVLNMFLPPVGAKALGDKSSPVPANAPASKKSKTAQVTMANIASVNKKLTTMCTRALEILAAEVGVGMDELVDNIGFSDLGVDSLMSLTVSGRIREELEIDVHSHDFNDHPTIGSFKAFLGKFETGIPSSTSSDTHSLSSADKSTSGLVDDSNVTTPLEDSTVEDNDDSKDEGLGDLIRVTIAEEMGVDVTEIAETIDLSSLGMDSLMSLSILGRLREKTDMSLPADLLTANQTIREIKTSLGIGAPAKPVGPVLVVSKTVASNIVTPDVNVLQPRRSATSVLLQGNSRRASKTLWLIPDGGGSATSYVDIPDLSPDVAVFGLNSPYMKNPEDYTCGVIGMASAFIVEIKRRQPAGPYTLAGWSAGGVVAFEAVNQLTRAGDVVDKLILIDSPCPDIIEPLPLSLHRWFASIGLLGDGDISKLPPWLLPHFAASVNALSTYTPESIEPSRCPRVTAIWCEDGVCKLPSDPRPDPFPYGHAQFLLDNRTDFGPNLWDRYLDPEKFECKHMPGNHFSMMKAPHVAELRDMIIDAINAVV
ncbi:BcPKS12, polyketide synthase [Marssonina coronariae]|uniref:BcPKS12, polyketide synthase n=1 Tax=Diplocarpon coronariae TaxID=2795749 RepID=A0A218YZ19_9HELO|nr:BcPKS12, polyketide synthase [Marssonina coronariae]